MPPIDARVQLFAGSEFPSSPTLRSTVLLLMPPERLKKIVCGSDPSSWPGPKHSILQTPHPGTTIKTDRRTLYKDKKCLRCGGLCTETAHRPRNALAPH